MAVRILHIADVHLDAPFTLFGAGQAEKRRNELRAAFSSAIMFAKDRGIQVCLISGDLFDGKFVTKDGTEFVASVIRRYPECMFFLAPGNHDPITDESIYSTFEFPANLHIFKEREAVDIPELNLTVCGVGFTGDIMTESPVAGWKNLDSSRINILCCHGDTSSSSSPDGPITEQELEKSPFDYVALGHIHRPSGVLRAKNTAYCYPGALVGRSYDEPGHHGVMYGSIDKGVVSLEFEQFSRLRYETAECDVNGLDKYSALDKIRADIKEYKSDTLLRLILTGTLSEGFTFTREEIGVGGEYPAGLEIIDKTSVKPKLSSLENDVSLMGVFCRKMAERGGLADGEDVSDIVSLAMKYGICALEEKNFNLITEDRND